MKVTVTELTQLHKCEAQVAYDAARGRQRSGAWERSRKEGVAAHKRLEGRSYTDRGLGKEVEGLLKAGAALLFALLFLFLERGGQ